MKTMSPPILEHFEYSHLPDHLQRISVKFHLIAHDMVDQEFTDRAELTAGLRKLLEAKDCMVRAAVIKGGHKPEGFCFVRADGREVAFARYDCIYPRQPQRLR